MVPVAVGPQPFQELTKLKGREGKGRVSITGADEEEEEEEEKETEEEEEEEEEKEEEEEDGPACRTCLRIC